MAQMTIGCTQAGVQTWDESSNYQMYAGPGEIGVSNGSQTQWAYLNFNWGALPGNIRIDSATVYHYFTSGNTSPNQSVAFMRTITSGWYETQPTAPPSCNPAGTYGARYAVMYGSYPNAWASWDVTQEVQSTYAGGRYGISWTVGGGESQNFHSRNGTAYPPYLLVNYTVLNNAPYAPGLTQPGNGANLNTGNPTFAWNYSDPDGSPQQWVQLQISPNTSMSPLTVDSGQVVMTNWSWTPGINLADGYYYWRVRTWDNQGAAGPWSGIWGFRVDKIKPNNPDARISTYTSNSATVVWNAYSDPAPSSGYKQTLLYFGEGNASGWIGSPLHNGTSIGNVTSYSLSGLKANTQYRYVVTQYDGAWNESNYVYKYFTTNAAPTTPILNLTSSGYLINKRPKFKVQPTDPNGSTLTNLQIQISTDSTFATTNIDATSSGNAAWSPQTVASGGIAYFTPAVDLVPNAYYARVRSHDGIEWGPWSATSTFTLKAPAWTDTIAPAATGVKKLWIDQLRQEINAIRLSRGLAAATWTDPTVTLDTTTVKAAHLTELRTAIAAAADTVAVTYTWTDPTITVDTTERKGQHWKELRDLAVKL